MWHAITDFLLKAHASGLSHEAVIEILIALLGVMIAVLTLVSGLFAVVISVIGWFGYQTIKEEAKEIAARNAKTEAKRVASKIARGTVKEIWSQFQASGVSEGQAEPAKLPPPSQTDVPVSQKPVRKTRKKVTRDANLKEGE